MASKHRHSKSWLISGGTLEWCYECGAIRRLRIRNSDEGTHYSEPIERWTKPAGIGAENPAMKPPARRRKK